VRKIKFVKASFAPVAAVALLGGGVLGGIALADHQPGHNTFSGGSATGSRVATSTNIFGTTAPNTWQSVSGTTLSIAVPSGSVRLVNATFSAEASGLGTGGCAARIVTRKSGSSTLTELYPQAGLDYIWKRPSGPDFFEPESRAMARSIRVGSGTRYFVVQLQASTAGSLQCRVDDWNFSITAHTS
jgi:hypothetical protein